MCRPAVVRRYKLHSNILGHVNSVYKVFNKHDPVNGGSSVRPGHVPQTFPKTCPKNSSGPAHRHLRIIVLKNPQWLLQNCYNAALDDANDNVIL